MAQFSEYAIKLGRIQVEAEAVNAGRKWSTKDWRAFLLPIAAREGLSADNFEYLATYLCRKHASDYQA